MGPGFQMSRGLCWHQLVSRGDGWACAERGKIGGVKESGGRAGGRPIATGGQGGIAHSCILEKNPVYIPDITAHPEKIFVHSPLES